MQYNNKYKGNNSQSTSSGGNGYGNRSYQRNNSKPYGGRNNRSSYGNRSWSSNNRRRSYRPKSRPLDKSLYVSTISNKETVEKETYTGKSFADFQFDERISQNITAKGFETTTEIQEKAIPLILEGKDVLGISATGSGKTGAFLIPMVQKLLQDDSQKLLVVAPTRELALQIAKEAISILRGTHLQVATIIGGESAYRQISQLNRGAQVIVGTPGRIKDLINRGNIQINQYNNVVIDEVDRMLDMGFIEDIRFIYGGLADPKQALFFSATHNASVEKIVSSLCNSFELIKLANNTPSTSVAQSIIDFDNPEQKIDLLKEILNREDVVKAIVFVDTKRYGDKVDKILYQDRFKVGVIHGDKSQNRRKRVIEMFKLSKINVLVATNVAARGLDVTDITHVINLDEPQSKDEYIHRIGRVGRNGSLGTAYTFVKRGR